MDINKENEISFISHEEKNTIKTEWSNAPSLSDLKQDLKDATPAKDAHVADVNRWYDILEVEGASKPPKSDRRSSVQPKVAKRNNEWRYPALSEPFLNTNDIFNVSPYTYEDKEAARQNALVLNYQFNYLLNKVPFIDEYVRTVTDEGTVFVRTGWIRVEEKVEVVENQFRIEETNNGEDIAILQEYMVRVEQGQQVEQEWVDAIVTTQETGVPHVPVQIEDAVYTDVVVTKNQPTISVVDYNNLIIDPSCDGVLEDAKFVIYAFETNKADLEAAGIYSNLDSIQIETSSILSSSDSDFESNEDTSFNFKDEPRKKFIAYEYWGYWDINGDGTLKPIVTTWVGDTIIRMEENPYPDKAPPFVSAQYLPVRKSLYGQPDSELIEDNQKIMGALMRGMIDILARSANGQTGMRKDLLDVPNKRKYEKGEDFEFNPNVDPRQGIHTTTFTEIPQSALVMLQTQQNEVETLTGIRPFGATATDTSSATQARGLLDAASKRETAILRRLSDGIKKIGHKIISMNQEFLEDEEIIRITNEQFVAIKREDLAGKFDLVLDISTAEEDNAKAQELAFMLQTIGPSAEPKMVYDIMADIADLRRMPELAHRLRSFQPAPPSEIEQAKAQIELEKLKLENMKLQLEMRKLDSEVLLNQQKAGVENAKQSNISADTDLKNLEYVEEELGVNHERDMAKSAAQASANLQRDLINHEMKVQEKLKESKDPSEPFRTTLNNLSQESLENTASGKDFLPEN